ncbi:MAG TPA: imidazole glycerol phosphate synthase subunit HisH [Pirellulales bacterium]|jgi:glutamine amidotransferase|nr:imidazole glycerol phosphate synthase subunit HisH [Pirellulales bacterium]
MIAIIDYGMGNLRSVQKGFEKVGHAAVITSDPAEVAKADKVVLPGVGAFADAMHELRSRKLIAPVRDAIASGKPFLGICLGLQLLFDAGYEDGRHEGLGVLAGEVVRFKVPPEYKVPHMGWNQLTLRQKAPLFAGLGDGTYVYFVHSYYVVPRDRQVIAAETNYPEPFCAAVFSGNIMATQFHPEKSQADGLRMLRNFAEWA